MSTIERPDLKTPPLKAGQLLDQPTFQIRYSAMPKGTWAELVAGRVYMPSPLFDDHGGTGDIVSYWLGHYRRFTPGLRCSSNVSTILKAKNEVQPDHQLRIRSELGGKARVVEGYVVGPPELIVEVARSSRNYDLGSKKLDYESAGVMEYIVVERDPDRFQWFIRQAGHYETLNPGRDGLFRSDVFPGLWLNPRALFDEDLEAIAKGVDLGLATPEHCTFVELLNRRV